MELVAILLVVFLIGVQVGQLVASWAIFYAMTRLIKVMMGRHEGNLVYRLPGVVYYNHDDDD
jgi:hypothetical protein